MIKVDDFGGSAKSLIAAVIAGLTSYQTALLDGSVTQQEWISVVVATLIALGAVYTVANTPKKEAQEDEAEQEEEPVDEPV